MWEMLVTRLMKVKVKEMIAKMLKVVQMLGWSLMTRPNLRRRWVNLQYLSIGTSGEKNHGCDVAFKNKRLAARVLCQRYMRSRGRSAVDMKTPDIIEAVNIDFRVRLGKGLAKNTRIKIREAFDGDLPHEFEILEDYVAGLKSTNPDQQKSIGDVLVTSLQSGGEQIVVTDYTSNFGHLQGYNRSPKLTRKGHKKRCTICHTLRHIRRYCKEQVPDKNATSTQNATSTVESHTSNTNREQVPAEVRNDAPNHLPIEEPIGVNNTPSRIATSGLVRRSPRLNCNATPTVDSSGIPPPHIRRSPRLGGAVGHDSRIGSSTGANITISGIGSTSDVMQGALTLDEQQRESRIAQNKAKMATLGLFCQNLDLLGLYGHLIRMCSIRNLEDLSSI
ncbi:hypothetical protein Tsubulata_027488 [Turnera subulata]|uniref:Uncharacterized protein n=1 Tax=Turnera subulata TaxID=218843 RepID=A0A9Q0JFZ4_9ROSI|nr:hypothetical protein Tsubulata_027488 [Turnera subulata]